MYYDNTGYNISSNNSQAGEYDALDSGDRNATSSYQADVEQTGVCIDCVDGNSPDAINYSGQVDDFGDVDESLVYDPTLYDQPRPTSVSSVNNSGNRGNRGNRGNNSQNNPSFVHSCKMKRFTPGYQVQPPKCWDMPQQRPPVCLSNRKQLPAAVFDRGTPLNALDLDTSVGSIMPKFQYNELSRDS